MIFHRLDLGSFETLIFIRNIIFAPISEEIVFRSANIAFFFNQINLDNNMLFLNPIWFGIAHLHHFYERYRTNTDMKSNIFLTLFQFSYTSLFAIIASYLFVRTGNIASPIASHMICNFMGVPSLYFLSIPSFNGYNHIYPSNVIFYKFRYFILLFYILGLFLFYISLFPMTEKFKAKTPYNV